jgi:hypothetical protein
MKTKTTSPADPTELTKKNLFYLQQIPRFWVFKVPVDEALQWREHDRVKRGRGAHRGDGGHRS